MASATVWWCYTLGVAVVVSLGVFACALAYWRRRKYGSTTTEFFLTARGSFGWMRLAWSFYAAAMGSWALFGPASYATYSGILGLTMYAVFAGVPIVFVAFFGVYINKRMPDIVSFSSYVKRRFGIVVLLYVSLLMLVNMGIAITAEYTAVGDLFEIVIGTKRIYIVVIIGIVAMIYTAAGGLYVSIVTDQIQAVASILLLLVLCIFVGVTFKWLTPGGAPPLGPLLNWSNYLGFASIAVMPISLITSTIFSEAMWQRCWATTDARNLKIGSIVGCCLVIIAVFMFGFGGYLAAWSGYWVPVNADDYGTTSMFSLLNTVDGSPHTWVTVVVTCLSVTMSESAIDSLQNAIVDNIATVYFSNIPVIYVRLLVLVLNIPPIVTSLQGYNILQLFLLANLLTTTSAIPVLAGLLKGSWAYRHINPCSMLSGCLSGFVSLLVWAKIDQGRGLDPYHSTYQQFVHKVFFEVYDWPPFVIALGFSVVGMFIGMGLDILVRKVFNLPPPLDEDLLMPKNLPVTARSSDDIDDVYVKGGTVTRGDSSESLQDRSQKLVGQ